jgi:hypothetical protein
MCFYFPCLSAWLMACCCLAAAENAAIADNERRERQLDSMRETPQETMVIYIKQIHEAVPINGNPHPRPIAEADIIPEVSTHQASDNA